MNIQILRTIAVVVALILVVAPVTFPTALADDVEFGMNDRFASAGAKTGASGSGEVEADDGSIDIEVEAENLLPNHDYELKVTIGPPGGFGPTNVLTFGPETSDDEGEIEFEIEDFDLVGLVGAGTYRIDLFVTHAHTPVFDAVNPAITAALGGRDPLLSCIPAPVVTVSAGDD